jgi:hypothetical protein
VGWVRHDGLGVRARYWEFDHCAPPAQADPLTATLCVDTYTFDVETFDTFCLNRNWDLEVSFGIRYTEFAEVMTDDDRNALDGIDVRRNTFSGYGGVAALELRRAIGTSGTTWVRARGAILMDDKDVFNDNDIATPGNAQDVTLIDVVVGMTELAFGYDYVVPICDGSYYFFRASAEWQNWYNFSSSFSAVDDERTFGGQSDVGFGGFGFGAGILR